MGRTTTIRFKDHLDDRTLRKLATIVSRHGRDEGRFLDGPEDEPDDELSLFRDHDMRRYANGYFRYGDAECRSRRLDMRGPLDEDPGPLAMPEGDAPGAVRLSFEDD